MSATLKGRQCRLDPLTPEVAERRRLKFSNTHLQRLLLADTTELSIGSVRAKVIIEQNFKCLECGCVEWRGKPLTLELDHINGDRKDNRRKNLRALCPNCHSQTETWRGRNNAGTTQRQAYLDRKKPLLAM